MHLRSDRRAGQTALTILVLILAGAPLAAGAEPLSLAEARRIAVERDAGRQALESESAAMRDMAVSAGQLPDPEARVGAVNVPVDSFALDAEDMTMLEVGVMQRFPAGRSRALRRARYESEALGADAEAHERARRVRLEVEKAWRGLDYLDESLTLLSAQSRWIGALVAGAEAGYAAGGGEALELLDARLMALEVDEKRLEGERERDVMQAELARWLGEDAARERIAAPVPARGPEPIESLLPRIGQNPMVESLTHMREAAAQDTEIARQMYRPAFGLDLAYGFRQGGMDGGQRPDMLTAMITFDVPLFTRNRQDREAGAAKSRERAADARRADTVRELEAMLRAAQARAVRLRDLVSLYEQQIERIAGVSVEAALAAYRASDGSLADVVATQKRVFEVRDRQAKARADYAVALAEIEYLAGAQP
jgi:outer membrane protein TolC